MVQDRASKLARGFVFDTLKDNDSATCTLFNAKWPTGPLDIGKLPLYCLIQNKAISLAAVQSIGVILFTQYMPFKDQHDAHKARAFGSGLGSEECEPEPKAHTYSRPGSGQAYYTRAGYGRAWAFEPGPAEHYVQPHSFPQEDTASTAR